MGHVSRLSWGMGTAKLLVLLLAAVAWARGVPATQDDATDYISAPSHDLSRRQSFSGRRCLLVCPTRRGLLGASAQTETTCVAIEQTGVTPEGCFWNCQAVECRTRPVPGPGPGPRRPPPLPRPPPPSPWPPAPPSWPPSGPRWPPSGPSQWPSTPSWPSWPSGWPAGWPSPGTTSVSTWTTRSRREEEDGLGEDENGDG